MQFNDVRPGDTAQFTQRSNNSFDVIAASSLV